MRKWVFAFAAATILAAGASPAVAQTWWTEPTVVSAGEGVAIIAGASGPRSAVVPLVTTARTVRVGPLLRVSGCTWARERIPGRWVRFRVCAPL